MLAALHRSVITDPMAIEGDIRSTEMSRAIKRALPQRRCSD